jgi:hypothetical protein
METIFFFGVAGFGYLAFSEGRKSGIFARGHRLAVWLSGTAAILWLLPYLVLVTAFVIFPPDCAEGNELCGLEYLLAYYVLIAVAVAVSLAAAITWVVYLTARRSAETE